MQKLIAAKQDLAAAEEQAQHGKGLVKTQQGLTDYGQDFFGKPTFLTVSGQLNAEIYATALSDVYTFGEYNSAGLLVTQGSWQLYAYVPAVGCACFDKHFGQCK